MEISNKFLAVLVVVAMGLSAISTFTLLGKISLLQANLPVTAKATQSHGTVNFTVESNVAILLTNSVIDFGSGTVNVSCTTNATLYAGQTYNDTNDADCWTDQTGAQPVSFNIMNDGNRRIQLEVKGPDQRAFLNYSILPGFPNNLTWKARNNETDACIPGATFANTLWQDFGGISKIICTNMTYQPSTNDEIAVDIQLVIPSDIEPGKRENTTIEFSAFPVT